MRTFSFGRDLNHLTHHLNEQEYSALLFVMGEWWGGTPLFHDMAGQLLYGHNSINTQG